MPGNEPGDLQRVSLPDGKLLRELAKPIPAFGEVIGAWGDALVLKHLPVIQETTRAGGDGQAIRLPREPATCQHRRWPVLRRRILCLLHQGVEREQRAAGRQGRRGGPEDRRIGRATGGNACQQHFVEFLLARATLRFGDRDTRVVLLEIPGDSVQSRAEVSSTARRPEGYDDLLPLACRGRGSTTRGQAGCPSPPAEPTQERSPLDRIPTHALVLEAHDLLQGQCRHSAASNMLTSCKSMISNLRAGIAAKIWYAS